MRAVRNTAEGVAVVDVAAPEVGPDHVVVHVTSSGICGSDLHMLEWGPRPLTFGHEFAGTLDDGSLVAVQPGLPCGACDTCLAGNPHLCRTFFEKFHGVTIDGGLADTVAVDPRCLVPLPPGVDAAEAGLVEPLAVAVHALNQIALEPGQRVLVIGGGTIGLASAAAAMPRGVQVDLSARHPAQQRAAEIVGAGREVGVDYDVVIEAAGSQGALDEAVDRVRPAGTILVVGTYWSPVTLPGAILQKEARLVPATVYGEHAGEREFAAAAGLLGTIPAVADAMISHRFGLDDAPEAFRVAADRAAGAIKVVVTPRS